MKIDVTLKNYRCFPDSDPLKITIDSNTSAIVGANNSGKSAILKFFYEFRLFFEQLRSAIHIVNVIKGRVIPGLLGCQPSDIINKNNKRAVTARIEVFDDESKGRGEATICVDNAVRLVSLNGFGIDDQNSNAFVERSDTLIGIKTVNLDVSFVTKAFASLCNTVYIGSFRNVLNSGASTYYDLQVGTAFVKQWASMQSGADSRQRDFCQQVIVTIEKMLGIDRLELHPMAGDSSLIVKLNKQTYQLQEIGSGIAQLIVVLATVAMRRPDFILIDEPELNLHPSLQLSFIAELEMFARNSVVFSTHNIGLARSCAKRIYAVSRVGEGHSKVALYEQLSSLPEFIGNMSYSSYHALGFTKVLLVEGLTDVRAIQQLLRKISKDHEILLIPLGGRSFINGNRRQQLEELKRITNDIFVLIDSEKASPTAELEPIRVDFARVCEDLGFKCHVLERRAIEYYLSDSAIKRVKGESVSALSHFDKRTEHNGWKKDENWRIIAEMEWREIEETDLGIFLKSI